MRYQMTGYVLSVEQSKTNLKGQNKMKPREIRPCVYWAGDIDWDRRIFDSLIPLPDGTSYNSYLIMGNKKTVLIDKIEILEPVMSKGFPKKTD